jgi:hypothetical protein
MKNPKTTIALTSLTHIISAIGGVEYHIMIKAVKTYDQFIENNY